MKKIFVGILVIVCLFGFLAGKGNAFTTRDFYGKTIYMLDITHRMVFEMQFLETGVLQTTIVRPTVHQIGERYWSVKFGRLVIIPDRSICSGNGNDEYFEILNDDTVERFYTVERKLIMTDVIWTRLVGFYYDQVTGYIQAVEAWSNLPPHAAQ